MIKTRTIVIPEKKGNKRIAHLPDLHLGRRIADFNKINSQTGNYFQLDDQIKTLESVIEIIIENNVTAAIFPGDIFDRPSNISEKLLSAFQENILKLIKNNIAVILLTGNHDACKSIEHKTLISRYDGIGEYLNIIAVHGEEYEKISINDELIIHAVPYSFSKETFRKNIKKVNIIDSEMVNILTTHIGVKGAGIKEYDYSEAWINKAELDIGIDYIALGDYHKLQKVSSKCYYSGVLCKGTFSDTNTEHGILIYDGNTKEVEVLEYSTRKMALYDIECNDKDIEVINSEIEDVYKRFSREAFIRIRFCNISKQQHRQIDFLNIHKIRKEAYYCKVEFMYKRHIKKKAISTELSNKNIDTELRRQLENITGNSDKTSYLLKLYADKIAIS